MFIDGQRRVFDAGAVILRAIEDDGASSETVLLTRLRKELLAESPLMTELFRIAEWNRLPCITRNPAAGLSGCATVWITSWFQLRAAPVVFPDRLTGYRKCAGMDFTGGDKFSEDGGNSTGPMIRLT